MKKKKKKDKEVAVIKEAMPTLTPFGELDRYFDDFFDQPFSLLHRPFFSSKFFRQMDPVAPSVDIYEENNDLVIKAEIPGMKKGDIKVALKDNTLTISGEKKQEEKIKKDDYYREERSYGSFCRRFLLPSEVNSDKMKATFKKGVLEIRAPKTAKKEAKKISVE